MDDQSHVMKKHTSKTKAYLTRILDPIDRLEETVFSILIVLIFTLAYRVYALLPINEEFFFTDAITIFWASLGAVIAWGLIDAIMYSIFSVFERKDRVRFLKELKTSSTEQNGLKMIADEFDGIFDPITDDEQRWLIYSQIFAALKDMQPKKFGSKWMT